MSEDNQPQAKCPHCGQLRDVKDFPEGYFCGTYHYLNRVYRTRECRNLEIKNKRLIA